MGRRIYSIYLCIVRVRRMTNKGVLLSIEMAPQIVTLGSLTVRRVEVR